MTERPERDAGTSEEMFTVSGLQVVLITDGGGTQERHHSTAL